MQTANAHTPKAGGGNYEAPSPHELGAQRYTERYGSLVLQAKRADQRSVLALLMVLVLIAGVVHLASQSGVQPYIIQVDEHGNAVAMGLAQQTAPGGDQHLRGAVGRFLISLRTVATDNVSQGFPLTVAYAMTAKGSAAFGKVRAREQELAAMKKRPPVHVKILSTERQGASDDFRIEFVETHQGSEGPRLRKMTAHLTAKLSARKLYDSEAQLAWNASRVFVTDFSLTDHGYVDANNGRQL